MGEFEGILMIRTGINIASALNQFVTTFNIYVNNAWKVKNTVELRFYLAIIKVPQAVANTLLVT